MKVLKQVQTLSVLENYSLQNYYNLLEMCSSTVMASELA